MRGVAEGQIELGPGVADELALCLGCRACESVCPSGVQYGAMLERGRAAVAEAGLRRGIAQHLEWLLLRHVVPHRRRLHALVSLLATVQSLGLDRLLLPLLPEALRRRHGLLPEIPPRAERRPLPAFTKALGARRGRVALLEGCVMPELFGPVNRATVEVLAASGFDVVVPEGQGCCGALHAHAGDIRTARSLAERNLAAFADREGEPFDAVVTNSAGCGAALRELDAWLPGRGGALGERAVDVCAFLADVGLRGPFGRVEARLCYDDPCHLVHGQGVAAAPRSLLAAIPGIELVPHADPAACCGAAGTYNLMQPDMSRRVLDTKLDALVAADPEIVATGNPGCLIQLRVGVDERGLGFRVEHPVVLLAEALRGAAGRPNA
jgi:Fe-S oxidoreductase